MDPILPNKKFVRKPVGAFEKMGLIPGLLSGIKACRYRLPTPIQRKTIPVIMDGHDVIAMARTGSGKTAAFLIPILQSLKSHSNTIGIRCLILSPTRELSVQTCKFAQKLCKSLDLRICGIVGGESIEEQFEGLSNNPDILVATPGRLVYILKETHVSLRSIQHVVFDEGDRLLEMGFATQLHQIIGSLPVSKQVLLFSATMPSKLIEFTHLCLKNPIIIRLDTDIKISDNLQLGYLLLRDEEKLGALLLLLQDILGVSNYGRTNKKLIMIFAATRYHVEFLSGLLNYNKIKSLYIYGSMEQTYRNKNLTKFRNNIVNILIVTDVAARGLDIPHLDYVINFNLPNSPKNFIHRVGRVARNGRWGVAWSLVSTQEIPYMIDICRFLGHKLPKEIMNESELIHWNIHKNSNNGEYDDDKKSNENNKDFDTNNQQIIIEQNDDIEDNDQVMNDDEEKEVSNKDNVLIIEDEDPISEDETEDNKAKSKLDALYEPSSSYVLHDKVSFGIVPRSKLIPYVEAVTSDIKDEDLSKLLKATENAMKLYLKTLTKPTTTSIKITKNLHYDKYIHPIFTNNNSDDNTVSEQELKCYELLTNMKKFRPNTTIFEIGGVLNPNYNMMQQKRLLAGKKNLIRSQDNDDDNNKDKNNNDNSNNNTIILDNKNLKKRKSYKDEKNYISNEVKEGNLFEEHMYSIDGNNKTDNGDVLKKFVFELDDDERLAIDSKKKLHKWNANKKKYTTEYMGDRINRYLTEKDESNHKIKSTHQYGKLYEQWKLNNKKAIGKIGDKEDNSYKINNNNIDNNNNINNYNNNNNNNNNNNDNNNNNNDNNNSKKKNNGY